MEELASCCDITEKTIRKANAEGRLWVRGLAGEEWMVWFRQKIEHDEAMKRRESNGEKTG